MLVRWFSLAALLAVATGASAQPSFADLAAASRRAEAEKRYDEALAATRALDAMVPDNPAIQAQIARQAALAERPEPMLAALDALARLGGGIDPRRPPYAALIAGRADAAAIAERSAAGAAESGGAATVALLSTPDTVVEGVAIDPRDGALLFADMHGHRIVRRPARAIEHAVALPDGIVSALGLKADPARRRLWQCAARRTGDTSRATLLLLDLATLKVAREIAFPDDGTKHLCNDVDILPDGRVAVTDSDGGRVWIADADGALAPLTPAGGFVYPNGVAVAADGRHLYVAHARGLDRVALAGGATTRLTSPDGQSLTGIDGLYRRGGTLIAVQNGMVPVRVIAIRLTTAGTPRTVETLARASPLFELPTTAAIGSDLIYVVGNAQFRKIDDDGALRAGETLAPTRVVGVALPRD